MQLPNLERHIYGDHDQMPSIDRERREQIKRDLEVSSFTNREGEEIFQATQPGRHGGMMGRTEDEARENYIRRIGDSS